MSAPTTASPSLRSRAGHEKDEQEHLAPCATRSMESRGRLHPEDEHPYRTAFQRDRDRVVHSTAFRRLQYKTQVFVYHEGDHYRNRLTHSMECAQITRTIARALGLNEDLAEAVALAHDLGHTPFGHAGERVLDRLLADEGGFDHNRQCLRVVDLLEVRDAEYEGLNLTDESREGILKHGCSWSHPVRLPELRAHRHLEAQIADAADEIAYTNHDLDDALRSGVLDFAMLADLPLLGPLVEDVTKRLGATRESVLRARLIVSLINRLVTDLIETTAARIDGRGVRSPADVRDAAERTAVFSPEVEAGKRQIKAFLFDTFYNHPRVVTTTQKAERIVEDLFRVLRERPGLLPAGVQARFAREGDGRAVADYVAGMTDRFAMAEHRKLLDPHEGIAG
ncbi:MAG: deoxyguanosinetriphosphate triphosphohydrolase [Deltaproteobacteria bacterium]|nr:deoxyguanosinetriphosphate triphosphohydrolase [Deltaproteobacteria bacterium]